MVAVVGGAGKVGGRLPEGVTALCCGGTDVTTVWVRGMGYALTNWEDAGQLTPLGGTQDDGVAADEENGWYMGLPPNGRGNDGGGHT